MKNPFRHHPNLEEFIKAPLESSWRTINVDALREMISSHGGDQSILLSEEEREADRVACLRERPEKDLWVFGYGSLIWDPGFQFSEVVRAHASEWQRRFILKDEYGGRGTVEKPGVMAALDRGDGCHGLAFRINERQLEEETRILWRRERVAEAYKPGFIELETSVGPLTALTFVVDHSARMIDADMTWDEQVRFCATGVGQFGTSLDYVENLVTHFKAMKIGAPHVCALLEAAQKYRDQQ